MYVMLHCLIVYMNCLLYYLLVENWMLVHRDDTRCIGDCQNGTLTERYRCESVSCQGINNYFSPALNGELEVVKRRGICNQQTVCQSKYNLLTLERNCDEANCDGKKCSVPFNFDSDMFFVLSN